MEKTKEKFSSAKTRNGRSRIVSGYEISLTKSDPLERLQEFCEQGKYEYKINWDEFQNGYMCECYVYYYLGKKSPKTLTKEVYWIKTKDLTKAKKTIAAILLHSIGLGDFEEDEESPEQDFLRLGAKALGGLVSRLTEEEPQSWADMASE